MPFDSTHVAQARRRARRRLGFYIHATIFVVVNLATFVINLSTTPVRFWAVFPLLGWGFGLLMHGMAALGPIERLYGALVERELARVRSGRDAGEHGLGPGS